MGPEESDDYGGMQATLDVRGDIRSTYTCAVGGDERPGSLRRTPERDGFVLAHPSLSESWPSGDPGHIGLRNLLDCLSRLKDAAAGHCWLVHVVMSSGILQFADETFAPGGSCR